MIVEAQQIDPVDHLPKLKIETARLAVCIALWQRLASDQIELHRERLERLHTDCIALVRALAEPQQLELF